MSGHDYLFKIDEGSGHVNDIPCFYIVKRTFWDRRHCFNDQHQGTLGGLLDEHWGEEMESCYTYWDPSTGELLPVEQGRQVLLSLGLQEIPETWEQLRERWSQNAQ